MKGFRIRYKVSERRMLFVDIQYVYWGLRLQIRCRTLIQNFMKEVK